MRALTVKQPWASLIASGEKRIENRTWRPPASLIGERIAIHAGAGWDKRGERHTTARRGELPQGSVVCTVIIDRVVEASDDPYWIGPIGWVLRDVEPVVGAPSVRGGLSLWRLNSTTWDRETTTAPSGS